VGDELAGQPVESIEQVPDEFRLAMPGVLWKPALSAIGRLRRYPAVQRDAEPASVGAGWEAKAQS
jgi:hypothetical protein